MPKAKAAVDVAASVATAAATVTVDDTAKAAAVVAAEREQLLKLITNMGYPEGEARHALRHADNNVEQAIQFLVEGFTANDSAVDEMELRKRRRCYKKLRANLMDNPDVTDYAIKQLLEKAGGTLSEMVSTESEHCLQALLDTSDEEEQPSA